VSYYHLDLVVAFFIDFVCRFGYSFFIYDVIVFHVINLSFSCNLFQMQRYCICLAFEGGVKALFRSIEFL
jgi:hypothetical protein